MKNSLATISMALICQFGYAQQEGGLEQYFYLRQNDVLEMVPMVHYQTKKGWYSEVRYNYEDFKTVSFYGGKIVSKEKGKLSYSLLPLLGAVMGKYQGGSLGLNINVEYKDFFLYSQSQYTLSTITRFDNFFYSWSEVGYEVWEWLYAGLALQHTRMYDAKFDIGETGFVLGFTVGKWVLPLYAFNLWGNDHYFIVGINRTLN